MKKEDMSVKEHVEEIRRSKFSIGGAFNPLTEDLHQAVKNLSAELYAKDVHFLMELIQNAEDNQYFGGMDPTLDFIITSTDITATGAPATLLIFNNEKGFSPRNIESICSVGRSTKKGNRISGYIGEKGIGFKSVFLITARPYIFSNGYHIRFNEEPCPHCGLGYIVPEWVEENPTLQDIKQIYRAGDTLPTTTFVLPLKPDKVKPVKQQLSSIHPEVLLFLSKIKRLSVRENNEDSRLNTISAVAISSEINFVTRKNINAESYTLRLSEEENCDSEKECSYYMWKQKFPVRQENRVERRMDVEEWVVTLAFPNQERLQGGKSLPGVYAFLPTEMVTNFPFIIQADFVLASSRETIILDDKWNQGILDCVPSAFMDAFKSLVIGTDKAPVSSLPRMFQFLPVKSSAYEELNAVREKIQTKLVQENIVPIETYKQQKHFYKPCEVGRLLPAFWDILTEAREQGISFHNLSSHGRYILSSSFDKAQYDHILNFLGVKPVHNKWYAKCIQSSNLLDGASEDVYLKLLLFIATNWGSRFCDSKMMKIPLIKYVGSDGSESHFCLNECTKHQGSRRVFRAYQNQSHLISWLIGWNKEFRCASNCFFMPESTQQAIWVFPKKHSLLDWLGYEANVSPLNVYNFAKLLCNSIQNNRRLAITYAHFLYHSFSKGYLTLQEVGSLCGSMPLVDNYGCVTACRVGVLVPANVSKWADLTVSNPWRDEGYIELGKEYVYSYHCAGQHTRQEELLDFLVTHDVASDIPHISAPDAGISGLDTPLTKENAFLLLDWIRNLKYRGMSLPDRFLKCIKEGSWLKVTVNGYRPPSESFLIGSSLGNILQSGSVLVDIPLVDQSFYGDRICEYEEELKTIGVMFKYGEACEFIGRQLMTRAASFTLSKGHVLLILAFIQYLRKSLLPADQFVNSIRGGSWLRTSRGYRSPVGSVLHDSKWQTASQISDIPFIDQAYYGGEIYDFKEELKLLGVIVEFNGSYQLVIDHLKSPLYSKSLTAEAVVLILECIRFVDVPDKLVNALKGSNCLKTNIGFKTPGDCFLLDPVWGCILDVFNDFPVIDHEFYGDKIFTYKNELKQTGLVVDFEEAVKAFAHVFKQKASQASFNKQHVESFLSCFRRLKETEYKFPSDFSKIIHSSKWLRTRVGDYRSPGKCILFGPDWESLSPITRLPFIDDSDNCYGKAVHEYKEELESMGVITDFKLGVNFVTSSLRFPADPSSITPENVFSLLECIQLLLNRHQPLKDDFTKGLSKHWLKTHAGYRPPDKCLLFDSKWDSFLKPMDGPFIDEDFYGSKIAQYSKELNEIGVTDDVKKGCSLIASHLDLHSEFSTIVQIYRCLNKYDWKPENEATKRVWIPKGVDNGEWVNPEECVNHDKDDLFGSRLHVLKNYYDRELLSFFALAMDVRSKPSLDDYIELWKEWESSGEQLSHDKCCKFWTFVLQHKSQKKEKNLAESFMKLPTTSGSHLISLLEKRDVFVADNLHLKNLFEQEKLFIWYPKPSLASLQISELLDLYKKIGVRTISESVIKEESSLLDGVELKQVDPRNIFIGKGLVKLILGFLACSSLKMQAEKRHEAVRGLLDLTVHETIEPVTVSYSLSLSSGDTIAKKANRMIRWERESSKLFTQKMDWGNGNTSMIKYATYFSEAISVGVLGENVDHVLALSQLIKLAFLLKFDEEAVNFLMESKDLQIFWEDEEFLSSAFPVN
ncbi:uncharacterized protein LOC133285633 [Gastrolobium bilobum]|uniref:uncharacterized protein LOC133285633 n=1 Tax=Gastrolobium bilobum TaxID=150636 RepID=UPI002AB2596C|nr:uncharacterized protein LOC133285633 [Gastrolobium bilobum]